MKAGYRDVKYNDKCPARRENEHDYDPAGPKEKGSVRGMRKREDKVRFRAPDPNGSSRGRT